jgi:hypothetical protein
MLQEADGMVPSWCTADDGDIADHPAVEGAAA